MNSLKDKQWAERNDVGLRLKAARKACGLGQNVLSIATGIPASFIGRLENEHDFLNIRRQLTYFRAIGVDPFEILDIRQEKLSKD